MNASLANTKQRGQPTVKAAPTVGHVPVGVGLRHQHYADALSSTLKIDFVEVHAENFFGAGGAARSVLDKVAQRFPVSLHATSLGLGSLCGIPKSHVEKLKQLVASLSPILVSDHASFAWGMFQGKPIHAGDLLPIAYNKENLDILAKNVSYVQDTLGRPLLVENIAAYITLPQSSMDESEFLTALCKKTGCRLLVDLNNLVVNSINQRAPNVASTVNDWIKQIPAHLVGEIHLAGCTPAPPGALLIDDHSRPVSSLVWDAYRTALAQFGSVPTLIEWDTDVPDWETLLAQVAVARQVAAAALTPGEKTCVL